MESWVLDGDSYSFLRSAPRNINLQHLDGPNRVEIFDITNIPSHRSAISETTCLCDIFGDDCESPSLPSSPAAASSLKKVADEQCEDINDSSGSYHTANGSENLSDGSDAFEDSKDTKDSILSETGKSNTQACDLTLPNEEREDSSTSNGSFKPEGNWQESQLSQDTGLERVENSSDQQLVTSTSEFRDTKIRVTGSTQEIISADLLSEIKGIRDHTTSTEHRETDSLDSSLANRDIQRNNTTSEVRENDSPQENKDSLKSLASEDTPEENNDLSCSGEEEEQISFPDILLTENNPTLKSDFSLSLTNYSNDGLDFTSLQKTDLSAKDETHDLRGMSAPLEHDKVPNKSTCVGTFLCDDKAGMSDLKDSNTLSPPTYVEDNSGTDEASMPQHFTISSETTETVLFDEQRSLTPFSVPTEKLTSCVISESCSPSGSSVDVDYSEPPIIIHSPVGFSLCPSPEPKKTCLAGPEDFEFTPDSPESEYRLTPTDGGSVSSFDSKLCPTPESRSVMSTPENNPNAFIYELSPAASSAELRSASCSPEIKITTYSSQNQQSLQIENNDFPSQNEVLAQNHDLEEIIHAEGFMPTTLPGKEFADRTVPTIYNLSSAHGEIYSLSTTLPRDTESPDLKGTRYAKSPMSIMLPTNKIISSNVSMDKCTIVPHSAEKATVSPDVHEIRFVENSISTIQIPANETTNMATSPVSNLSSTEEGITRSPFTLGISGDTSSPDVFRAKSTENSIPNTLFTKDNENMFSSPILDSLSTEGGISRPSNGSAPRDTGSPDRIVCVENPASTTLLTNEPTFLAISPLSTPFQCPTASNDSNDSGNVSERELVGSAKAFGPIGMRPGEIPGVLHSNNHSMYEGQSCRNKGWSGKRVIQEEHALEKGVGNLAEGSYRGEQVDLSFSTRNRKGPANHSPAPSSRDPKSGIPPRYFESPLATQEQQSLLRAQNLQKENNNSARRVRSSSQGNYRGARYLSLESTSETSNMGSEFDAADTEVKWFADQAFRGLSSPQVDYLDVYSSSRESSTNVSQPSTVDSPGSATWISYADLHDSLHENDNALCHTAAFLPSGTLNPAKCFDMGSFECVDVAVESKEETKRGKKTVPKRQIQFKRRNIDESGVKAMDSLSTETCARETFVRQHSTPASMQEDLAKGNHEIQTGKKMLQKSASLDECSPKSKIASTVIKSVLSKKMDTATNESLKSEPCEDKKKYNETLSVMELSNAERPSSRVPSEYSLSSEDFAGNEERSPHPSRRKYWPPKVPPKPFFKPNSIPSNNNPAGVVFQDIPFVNDQIKPIMVDAIKSKISKQQGSTEKEASKLGETFSSESGSASNRAPNCTAVCVASTLSSVNNHRMTPETCKQQESSNSMFLSKTPEITLKPCAIKDKNKSSTKAFVCPEPQTSKDTLCEPQLEETIKEQMSFKPGLESENEEDIEKSKAKSVIHKVRDVRKLVKNTYNLSFKASNTTHVEDVQVKMQPENPHPLQIECKAISWKDKTSSCSKSTTQQDVEEMSNKSKHSQMDSPQENDVCITKITAETSLPNVQYSDMDFLDKCSKVSKSGNSERPAQLETPPRPSSKEISTLVFLQDSTPKSTQKPTIPASPSAKIANNSHSVSMLRKEKGMQADIGVCDVLSEGAGAKPKHINRLEVPLQTYASGETSSELQKGEKEVVDSSPEQKTSLNNGLQTSRGILQVRSSPKPKEVKILPTGKAGVNQSQPANEQEVTFATESKAEPQFGHPYHSSQNQTPPIPHSPGQVISYPGAPPQAQVRPHKCRPDGQPLNYTSVSPKTAVQQSPAMVQPMHHSHTCPAPGIQLYGNEQQQSSTQHMERRSGNQRSPQAPSGATYREHSRSPSIAALDTRSHFFNPQELPPAFGNEYGSDGSGNGGMLYPENASGLGYGQGPRRVLLDPETGKYFYIEVPMQPLRKMLFDPEIGQYVEVLIPQQAMSNSSMYPPTSAPYQGPYHGQGLYASQYLPYSMPPHPQSAQQPRHPEPSVPTSLHQNTMGYGSSASQAPKSDVKGHPSLDQSYLESMYYIPTGINASPNSTPSDCYHKPATNMPAAGGRRA
ncbi:hypothetical protein C0J45_4506 [Silurus meridionalis]|nr:hypothetical protein C0J45_4506 [Silurus meridionalis]